MGANPGGRDRVSSTQARINGAGPLVELEDVKQYFPIKSGLVLDRHIGDGLREALDPKLRSRG